MKIFIKYVLLPKFSYANGVVTFSFPEKRCHRTENYELRHIQFTDDNLTIFLSVFVLLRPYWCIIAHTGENTSPSRGNISFEINLSLLDVAFESAEVE